MNKLIIYMWGACFACISYAQEKARFIHLEDKIPDHTYQTVSMAQDTLGNMWISQISGVSKYNGYGFEFIPYAKIFGKESNTDRLDQIVRDNLGTIWFISQKGEISRTDKKGGFLPISNKGGLFQDHKISQFLSTEKENWIATKEGKVLSYSLTEKKLEEVVTLPIQLNAGLSRGSMVLTPSNRLCLISAHGNLYVYDLNLKRLKEIEWDKKNSFIFNTGMTMDKYQRLWITTNAPYVGMLIYDTKSDEFVQSSVLNEETLTQTKMNFSSILTDAKGTIWAGTDGNGLYKIDPDTGELSIYNYDIFDSGSLSSNTVIDIFEDRLQNLWVTNNYGEINVLSNEDTESVNYHSGAIKNSPSVVLGIHKDKDGTHWFGTDGKGLVRISPEGDEKQFLVNENFSKGFYVEEMVEDDNGNIWLSSQVNGVWIFDKKTSRASQLKIANDDGIVATPSYALCKDSKGRLWVSTSQGILVYDSQYRVLANFRQEPRGALSENVCSHITEDHQGRIWLALEQGLYTLRENLYDFKNSTLIRAPDMSKDDIALETSSIMDMAADEDNLWLVKSNGKLHSYGFSNKDYVSYEKDTRFKDVKFKSVEVTGPDELWLGSNKGLWHLDFTEKTYTTYFKSDGFSDDSFLSGSYQDTEGNLYFGTRYGVNYFSPTELNKKTISAKLFVEGIEVLNRPALSIIPDQLQTTVQNVKEIHLDYDQASFSFDYVALDNVLSPSFHYAHRLVGYDNQWTNTDKPIKATYTNLPPGNYEFQVRAGTHRGNWNLGQKEVKVQVAAPFYRQNWAISLYILVALGLLYILYRWIALRNRLLAEELDHQADKARYDLKMNFFAKISHEIQTPLTLILIPIENMMQNASKSGNELLQKRLRMISNNARRLSRIVFELTTVRNKELGQLKLSVAENNIVEEVQEIASSFQEQAELKNIDFKTTFSKKDLRLWYDKTKIEHILYNLLSNAFKFTPEGGHVQLDIWENEKEEKVLLRIKDSGPGIPKESLQHIFELFYQGDTEQKNLGMGVGLALVKELIDLHRGTITVSSTLEEGTCFTLALPMKEHAFSPSEKLNVNSSNAFMDQVPNSYVHVPIDHITDDFTKTILIVEDNSELQDYLKKIFGGYFTILTANNGMEGFEVAKKKLPNLIVSDIMMPKLNGIEMTKKLRKNRATAHIPVILLTAEKTQVNKIMALRVGAIEYLNKPFNINELILKANNIMTRGDRLKSKFKSDLIGTPSRPQVKSKDETFLENLVELIEKNMENPDFRVEELSKDLNTSYSVIYKKFQGLTGKTIVDFVRSMRLKKAAMYLTESNFSVTESAFSVGFNDPKYFSKCFKNEFGQSPLAYKKQFYKGLIRESKAL